MNFIKIFKKHFLLDCTHEQLNKVKKELWQCSGCKRYFNLHLYLSEIPMHKKQIPNEVVSE